MVGLDHRLDHFPAQLSGGEQQRVAIARAIAKRPDVLLCDEPTGALDITTGIVVLEALERVNRELGTATVVITHNAAIAGMADRVVRLADGRVAGVERNATKITARGAPMVTMPARLRALDRKLLRDLWAMKGQSLAIAVGHRRRRGDVRHVSVELRLAAADARGLLRIARDSPTCSRRSSARRRASRPRIAALPGVESVATRVVADVTLDVPGMAEPAIGRLISLPERGRPPLNDVYLRRGRWVDPTRPDEVLASEMFCDAHGFNPGDRVAAIINGRRRWLTIVGDRAVARVRLRDPPGRDLSGQAAVRHLLDEPARPRVGVQHGGRLQRRVDRDRREAPTTPTSSPGSTGCSSRTAASARSRGRVQISAWTLDNELRQLQTFGFITPVIFLGVAAFILNVALARALVAAAPADRGAQGARLLESASWPGTTSSGRSRSPDRARWPASRPARGSARA